MQAISSRDDRILAKKLDLLFANASAAWANLIVGTVIAYQLRNEFPRLFLIGWLSLTALITVGRIALKYWYRAAAKQDRCNPCWTRKFTLGCLASGLAWGAMGVSLLFWGGRDEVFLLCLVGAGMTAGALTTVLGNYPAYLAYTGPIAVSMSAASIASTDHYVAANGWLILVYFSVIVVVARNGSRAVSRSIAVHVDLEETSASLERTRIERDAARREKWSTLGQLSHELRTPLNAIMGFSEAMSGEYFGPIGNARYKDYAAHVNAGGRHLLRLIDELLDLSRSESGQLEMKESPVELDILLASSLDIMQAEAGDAGLTLKRELGRGLPLVRADKTKLRQIVLNLLSNAIKFTPAGGTIMLRGFAAPGGGIAVAVEDTGIGMTAEDIEVALTPFGRIAGTLNDVKPGMGLGLPMAKRYAELHGAELSIVSEPGCGTTCTVWFPAERCIGEIAPPAGAICASAFAA